MSENRRLEAAARALAEANWQIHGPKDLTWSKAPGYMRGFFRHEATKILAVLDAVLPGALRQLPRQDVLSVKLKDTPP